AFDWIKYLTQIVPQYNISSIADIPCGDTYWQFGVREINTIAFYFGGDIASALIEKNQYLYQLHQNKLFQYWDIVQCELPTFSFRNITKQSFDLVIVRDAIQHMSIKNGLRAVKNVVLSGAKYFAVSSYPAPCVEKICAVRNIVDGGFYHNNINCPPFNFPINATIFKQPSHSQFKSEKDEFHMYKIDDILKQIVKQYDKACMA
ncbi:unnamed protein product, partial [Didymodactylos carnosus]